MEAAAPTCMEAAAPTCMEAAAPTCMEAAAGAALVHPEPLRPLDLDLDREMGGEASAP